MQTPIVPKNKKERALFFMNLLKKDFPVVDTPLIHKNAFQLLVATILSTQTLDTTTNKVTPKLFKKYPDVYSLSKANPEDIDEIILFINYHRTKSLNLIKMANQLIDKFGGNVTNNMEDLISLAGVGRKVANVVISEWFGRPYPSADLLKARKENGFPDVEKEKDFKTILPEGFVVDTHVLRISQKWGFTNSNDPKKVEQDLMKLFPKEEWVDMSLRMIFHGRTMAQARNPKYLTDGFWSGIYEQL